MQNASMARTSAITLRVPPHVKKALSERAGRAHRSLSAEALNVMEAALRGDTMGPGRFLGMFAGSRVPAEDEILEARRELWARLRVTPS